MTEYATMADWVRSEMTLRGLTSGRAFAEWLGVSHSVINSILKPRPDQPGLSMHTLVRMAEKTGANLFMLVALAYPEHRRDLSRLTSASPGVLLRAQLIEELPKQARDIIDGIIRDQADKRDRQ